MPELSHFDICESLYVAGILTAVNSYNVRWATRVQDVFTYAKVLALLLIVGTGLVLFFQGQSNRVSSRIQGSKLSQIFHWPGG